MLSPLEQFKLKGIYRYNTGYVDLSITNSTIMTLLGVITLIGIRRIREEINKKIEEINKETIGKTKYIPITETIIGYVTINNIIGLIPYSYTTTSQIITNITMSMTIIIGITIIGIKEQKIIELFTPVGVNRIIKPIITIIEIISYVSRIISLSVRLTANMISGHIMLNLITTYGYKINSTITTIIIIPFIILETFIGIIQGYVFTILTSTYIKDIEGHK